MHVVLLNDTRADTNPGCQATVSTLVRQLGAGLDARVTTRPRGEGYQHFAPLAGTSRAHAADAWYHAVSALAHDAELSAALAAADLVVANLEGTFHHHTVGALALGGAMALAHRLGRPLWAINGTVEAIEPWLLAATLMPAAHVAVREPRSARWLRARGLVATSAADAAFLAETFVARDSRPSAPRAVCYTPGVLHGTAVAPDAAVHEVLGDLETLRAAGWTPTFVQLEDREASLADAARRRGFAVDDARTVAWPSFGAYLRRFGLVVSGRYHVLIFAAMAGVPLLARPSNTHKIEGLLELIEQPDAFAADTPALADRLRGDLPRPVTLETIRACQARARAQVPASIRTATFVTGLDWTPADDLPQVLRALRTTAPPALDVVVGTTPWDAATGLAVPVRGDTGWRAHFDAAGFDVTGDRVVPGDTRRHAPAWCATPLVNPLADPAIGSRRVFSVRRRATAPDAARPVGQTTAADTPATHMRVVIADPDAFDQVAPELLARAPGTGSAVLRLDAADCAWSAALEQIAMWCASHGIAVWRADGPEAVDWEPSATRRLLLVPGYAGTAHRRVGSGAFIAAARRHGWHTIAAPADVARVATTERSMTTHGQPRLAAALDHALTDVAPRPVQVALFGASTRGRQVVDELTDCRGITLCGVFDNDATKWHTSFSGLPVLPPTPAAFGAVDVVLVSSLHADAIARQVTAAGFGTRLMFDVQALAPKTCAAGTTTA